MDARVTVSDVLDIGACIDGVKDFIERNGMRITCDPADFPSEDWIQKAANNGYGYGYGDGDGDG